MTLHRSFKEQKLILSYKSASGCGRAELNGAFEILRCINLNRKGVVSLICGGLIIENPLWLP